MNIPSSFCSICTNQCKEELLLLLLTLSIHHENSRIYIMCDEETRTVINNATPDLNKRLNIKWFVELNKYSSKTRSQMVEEKIWSEFQMMKANVMIKTLEIEKDTLFLDSDIIILDKINDVDHNKRLGVSPQYITEEYVKRTGYYNGGMLWTSDKNVPVDWIEYTKTSRYYDQASIEDLAKKYDYFEFGENYNLQCWRFVLGLEPTKKIKENVNIQNNKLYYKNKQLKCIHTHFNDKRFMVINDFLLNYIGKAKYYKEYLCISRMLYDKWVILIPNQPMKGIWNHKNDSFRELVKLWSDKVDDVIVAKSNFGNCILQNIVLYDRPTLEWINKPTVDMGLLLLGNGDVKDEGKMLEKLGIKTKPWIFWPRRPELYEKYIDNNESKKYDERKHTISFIGNIENEVQHRYRHGGNWETMVDNYHRTQGQVHKFTQEEYISEMANSKYGLCLRGYGKKCHREVELMGLGTVLIVTDDVNVDSYINPLIEGKHYIKINNINDWKEPNQEEWEEMSKNCREWYMNNIHSSNSWKVTIESILYDSLDNN
jgi:hypothetical protein